MDPLSRELGGILLTILKLLLADYKTAEHRLPSSFSFGGINAQISSGEQRRLADMRKMTCLATPISALELAIPGLFAVYDRQLVVLRSWRVSSV